MSGSSPAISGVISVNGLSGVVTVDKTTIGLGNVDDTSDADKPVSTAQQTALDTKLAKASNLSDLVSASTARTNLGLATVAASGDHVDLLNKGTNTHAQIDTHLASVANPHAVTIGQVSPLTTKGDIMVRNSTVSTRLAVGTNNLVLTADSTAPEGAAWKSVPGSAASYAGIVVSCNTSSNPFISTASTSYVNLTEFIFPGSNTTGPIAAIRLVCRSAHAVQAADFRVFDRTNGLVIAEVLGVVGLTRVLTDMGAVSNVPALAAVFEIQARRVSAPATAEISSCRVAF